MIINKNSNELYILKSFQIEDNEDWYEVQSDWIELDPTVNN